MTSPEQQTDVPTLKDAENERPVPSIWRPVFCKIVSAFARHDYQLENGVACVLPVTADMASRIEVYIRDYGEKLVDLPEETWDTSVCIWMGKRWDVLVDLWTEGEGRSDLVLNARVSESDSGFVFEVSTVHVP